MHPTTAPFLWHLRVSEGAEFVEASDRHQCSLSQAFPHTLSPLLSDPCMVRNCSSLKEAFYIGWGVGKEAPPNVVCFCSQGIEMGKGDTHLRAMQHSSHCSTRCWPRGDNVKLLLNLLSVFWGSLVTQLMDMVTRPSGMVSVLLLRLCFRSRGCSC